MPVVCVRLGEQQRQQQQAEKQKVKKTDPSVNRQQSLMASWLRRPPAPVSGGPLGSGTPGSAQGARPPPGGPHQALGVTTGEDGGLVVVLDEEEQADIRQKMELRRAAEAEAIAWRVAPEDKEEFVEVVERLAGCTFTLTLAGNSYPQTLKNRQDRELGTGYRVEVLWLRI